MVLLTLYGTVWYFTVLCGTLCILITLGYFVVLLWYWFIPFGTFFWYFRLKRLLEAPTLESYRHLQGNTSYFCLFCYFSLIEVTKNSNFHSLNIIETFPVWPFCPTLLLPKLHCFTFWQMLSMFMILMFHNSNFHLLAILETGHHS